MRRHLVLVLAAGLLQALTNRQVAAQPAAGAPGSWDDVLRANPAPPYGTGLAAGAPTADTPGSTGLAVPPGRASLGAGLAAAPAASPADGHAVAPATDTLSSATGADQDGVGAPGAADASQAAGLGGAPAADAPASVASVAADSAGPPRAADAPQAAAPGAAAEPSGAEGSGAEGPASSDAPRPLPTGVGGTALPGTGGSPDAAPGPGLGSQGPDSSAGELRPLATGGSGAGVSESEERAASLDAPAPGPPQLAAANSAAAVARVGGAPALAPKPRAADRGSARPPAGRPASAAVPAGSRGAAVPTGMAGAPHRHVQPGDLLHGPISMGRPPTASEGAPAGSAGPPQVHARPGDPLVSADSVTTLPAQHAPSAMPAGSARAPQEHVSTAPAGSAAAPQRQARPGDLPLAAAGEGGVPAQSASPQSSSAAAPAARAPAVAVQIHQNPSDGERHAPVTTMPRPEAVLPRLSCVPSHTISSPPVCTIASGKAGLHFDLHSRAYADPLLGV